MNHARNNNRRPNSGFSRPQYDPRARAGLVMTRDMDFGAFGDAERVFFNSSVMLAPVACGTPKSSGAMLTVLPTAGLEDLRARKLTGLVVPGGDGASDAATAKAFDTLVAAARDAGLPILAFADGAPRVLKSLGFEPDEALPPAVLVHNGVRVLETDADVRDAIGEFRTVQKAAA